MKRFSSFLVLAIIPVLAISVSAETVKLDSPDIEKQKTAVWCWAASIQNALASYDVKVEMEEVVKATYGRVVEQGLFDPREAVINLLRANAKVAPKKKVVHPFIVAGPPAPSLLLYELSMEKSPVMVFYKNSPAGGHVVVCYGVEYEGNVNAPIITKVFVKDPWDAKEKEWGGAQLAKLWTATIFLRVADEPRKQFQFNGVNYRVSPTFDIVNPVGQVEGRVWYFNSKKEWRIIDVRNQDRGAIPD